MTERPPAPDPATRYAEDLRALFASARDLLSDDGYVAVLPHLEALLLVLPDPIPSPPCPHPLVVSEETWPTDREAAK